MPEAKRPNQLEENPQLFKDSFFKAESGIKRKALALPIAIVLHAIFVAAIIVIPLLSTDQLPKVEVYSAFLAPPPPPPPP
ncbi:MAG: TonB family protein, partial [Candidatus Saccharicenans sp.]